MFNVDKTRLNPSEHKIVDELVAHAKNNPSFKITEAAEICGCSVSQVSKAIKKAGFSGYKNFIHILYTGEQPRAPALDELERLKRVIEDFDIAAIDEFVSLIYEHEKIIFFGYGPSLISTQYFEYKLRFCSNAFVTTAPDEQSAKSMLDRSNVLVIFTTPANTVHLKTLPSKLKRKGPTWWWSRKVRNSVPKRFAVESISTIFPIRSLLRLKMGSTK